MSDNTTDTRREVRQPRKSRLKRAAAIIAWTLAGLVALCVLLLCGLTWYLTPKRLTDLINREASTYLQADVKVENARFTFWSTFPRFCIETDSIRIVSRTLRDTPDSILRQLPPNPEFLASAGSLKGGINIMKAIAGEIALHNLQVDGMRLNLVAYNDSINNYRILPASVKMSDRIPYFSADSIIIAAPGDFSYFSAATKTQAHATIAKTSIVREKRGMNRYHVRIPGEISAVVDDAEVLSKFPFELDGVMNLRFHPFGFRFDDYSINLGNTRGKLSMDMKVGKEMTINNLSYSISPFNINGLLKYFPGIHLPKLEEITTDMDIEASARFTEPWNLSANTLPQIDIDFRIPSGEISYTLDSGESYTLAHNDLDARFFFDGKNPGRSYVDLAPFSVSSDGLDCTLSGNFSDILSKPLVDMDITAKADIAKALKPLSFIDKISASGDLDCDTHLHFLLSSFYGKSIADELKDIGIGGKVKITNLKVTAPARKLNITSPLMAIDFGSKELPKKAYDMNFLATASSISVSDRADSLNLKIGGLTVKGHAPVLPAFNPTGDVLDISAKSLKADHPELKYNGKDIKLALSSQKSNGKAVKPLPLPAIASSPSDAEALDSLGHTPAMLTAQTPKQLLDVMKKYRLRAGLSTGASTVSSRHFPVANRIQNLQLEASFDSIVLHRLRMRSQSTGLTLSAKVGNLRQFLSNRKPAILPLEINLMLDTVNINQLARAYESGQVLTKGMQAVSYKPKSPLPEASDSIAMLLPRNIRADIKASAKETVYMNLHLYDLSTEVHAEKGDLLVKDLKISSDFGKASLGLNLATSDIEKMGVSLDASMTDINVVSFFKNFHTLLLMMPQMKNLDGVLGVHASANLGYFPDMYLNIPSVNADITLTGRHLLVHQDPFIRRIVRMMLIHTDGDLHIENMDVHATVHDNLLELYPFNFEFDRYKLTMEGLNNFNGNLYYHIGVLKSPVPFHFGINIVGQFHDPKLRFGGALFKVDKAREITSEIYNDDRVNIVKEVKYYLKEFVEKAAESDSTGNSEYTYSVPDYRSVRKAQREAMK